MKYKYIKKNIIYILLVLLIIFICIILYYNKSEKFEDIIEDNNNNTAYVINLDKRPDRYKKIIKNFKDYNINMKRISGVYNKKGWKGCGYSHMKIIKLAKEYNLPSILILEDDCKPTKYFNHWFTIKKWLDNNRDKWEIFIGGNSYYGSNNKDDTIKGICKLDDIKLYYATMTTTHFVYLNSSAYDKMLGWASHIEKNELAIDRWPNLINMKRVMCVPSIAIQDEDYSDIEKRDVNYTTLIKKSEEIVGMVENNIMCETYNNF